MVIVMNGEHGGSFSAGLAMEWYEEEEGRKPNFGVQVCCPIDRSPCVIDRTEEKPQLTGKCPVPIDRVIYLINRTGCTNWELFSADRSDLRSDQSEGVGSLDTITSNLRNL